MTVDDSREMNNDRQGAGQPVDKKKSKESIIDSYEKKRAAHKGLWLTSKEDVEGYIQLAKELKGNRNQDTGARRKLKEVLQEEFGLTDIEAVNILNEHNIQDYITKYTNLLNMVIPGIDKEGRSACYCDIHQHIIPLVDDGAGSFEESLTMLELAYDQGIRHIVATPHSASFDSMFNNVGANYNKLLEQAANNGINIDFRLGSEILLEYDSIKQTLKKIRSGRYPQLGDSNHVLVEFDMSENDWEHIEYCACSITDIGLCPIIAHAERYNIPIDRLYTLTESGCKLQVNYDVILPVYKHPMIEKTNKMLKDKMVSYIATDTHRMDKRPPVIYDVLDYLYENFNTEYINSLVCSNALKDLFVSKG